MNRMGCLIYNGLTRGGVHFVGVYALFIAKEGTPDAHLEIPLLACSPMPSLPSEDEEDVEEAAALCAVFDQEHDPKYTASFNAETHTNFLSQPLPCMVIPSRPGSLPLLLITQAPISRWREITPSQPSHPSITSLLLTIKTTMKVELPCFPTLTNAVKCCHLSKEVVVSQGY